jgi:hypothetical protein
MKNNKKINYNNFYHKSNYDLYISQSNIINSGLGVFTQNFIPKNTCIDEYFGEYSESLLGGEYFFRIDDECGINAIDLPRCYMAMLNDASYIPTSKRKLRLFVHHDYKNNCYFNVDTINKKVYVYSLQDIEVNSELFISYGCDYWK